MLARILYTDLNNIDKSLYVYDCILNSELSNYCYFDLVFALAMMCKGRPLFDQLKYDEASLLCDKIMGRYGNSSDPALHQQVAMAMVNKGWALGRQGKYEDAIHWCDEVMTRYGNSADPTLRESVAKVMVTKGATLCRQGKYEDAIHWCDEVMTRYGDSSDPAFLELVTRAMFNKGWALYKQDKYEDAILLYDEVMTRYGDSADPVICRPVALAMGNKGLVFSQQGKDQDAIRCYDEVMTRYGDSSDHALREPVALAMVNKGLAFSQQGKDQDAIRCYDEVMTRYGDSSDPALREPVARAMGNKGVALGRQGKTEDEIRQYDELLTRYGDSSDPALRDHVAKAILYKARTLLETGHPKEGRKTFDKATKEYFHEVMKSDLADYYTYLQKRFTSILKPEETENDEDSITTIIPNLENDPASTLRFYLRAVLKQLDPQKRDEYFEKIDRAKERTDGFIRKESRFVPDLSFLLVLREWNSYTPVIPGEEESDRGGGYFIRHAGEGIVIDPGYDFIENFHRAGGRLCDIDHIIVTHAHDDHTAELEALLMLFHRRWNDKKLQSSPKKRLNLYLSAGVHRKFAGLLNLRNTGFGRIVTLCPPAKGETPQQIRLNALTTFTVMPAYHDDVLMTNGAVGLGFEFFMEDTPSDSPRRIVFTGDSGLYPLKLDENGKKKTYSSDEGDNEEAYELDTLRENALHERYIEMSWDSPHLLVAHIGSIKKKEFRSAENLLSSEDAGRWYYENHLGLLGTLTMLHRLNPDAAIISEFGSELRDFHFELVEKLREALHDSQDDDREERKTFVVPGDLTIAYDIAKGHFLRHDIVKDECVFCNSDELKPAQAIGYVPVWESETKSYGVKVAGTRAFLC